MVDQTNSRDWVARTSYQVLPESSGMVKKETIKETYKDGQSVSRETTIEYYNKSQVLPQPQYTPLEVWCTSHTGIESLSAF